MQKLGQKLVFPLFICLFSLVNQTTIAQKIIDFDTLSLVSGDKFILNSVNRTNISNGRNRNAISYKLPANCSYVLLRVLIDNSGFIKDKNNYQSLMSKFTAYARNPYGLLSGAMIIEAVTPHGSGKVCDFYIPAGISDFQKFNADGHPWKYKVEELSFLENYTRRNTQSFALMIETKDLEDSSRLFLAFQNHSLTESCAVLIDIIAFLPKKK